MNYIKAHNYKKVLIRVDPNFEIAKEIYRKYGFVYDYYDTKQKELVFHKNIE